MVLCWVVLLFLGKISEFFSKLPLWMIVNRHSSVNSKSKGKVNPGMLTIVPHPRIKAHDIQRRISYSSRYNAWRFLWQFSYLHQRRFNEAMEVKWESYARIHGVLKCESFSSYRCERKFFCSYQYFGLHISTNIVQVCVQPFYLWMKLINIDFETYYFGVRARALIGFVGMLGNLSHRAQELC